MYSYVDSYSLSRTVGSVWQKNDLSQTPLVTLFTTYQKVYLVLKESVTNTDVCVELIQYRNTYGLSTLTLSQWLSDVVKNTTLKTQPLPALDTPKRVKYIDAFAAGYHISHALVGVEDVTGRLVSDLVDLKMVRKPAFPTTDMRLIDDYCLVTCSGYIHWTQSSIESTYIYQAGKTLSRSTTPHGVIGVVSFMDIGKLTKIKLNINDIVVEETTEPRLKLRFTTKVSSENKSPLFCLFGHLIFPDETAFWRVSDYEYVLDLSKLDLLEKFIQAKNHLDFTDLALTTLDTNADAVDLSELYDPVRLKKLLTHINSFLVLVDHPNVCTQCIGIRQYNTPGIFETHTPLTSVLMVSSGRIAEYWSTQEGGVWSHTVLDSYLRNFVFSKTPYRPKQNVTGDMIPTAMYGRKEGYIMDILAY